MEKIEQFADRVCATGVVLVPVWVGYLFFNYFTS